MKYRRHLPIDQRGVYEIQFSDGSVYVGLSYNPIQRFKAHKTAKTRIGSKLRDPSVTHKFCFDGVFFDLKTGQIEEQKRIDSCKKRGLLVLNVARAGSLGSKVLKWNFKDLAFEAKKYSKRQDFKEQSPIAYELACRRKVLSKITLHMPKSDSMPAGYWTKEKLVEEMSKYKRSCDFKKFSGGAYWSAKNQGIDIRKFFGPRIGNTRYSFQEVFQSASEFKTITEWRNKYPHYYKSSYRRGWHQKIVSELFSR